VAEAAAASIQKETHVQKDNITVLLLAPRYIAVRDISSYALKHATLAINV
jgi:hypothetical protein